jgi:tRNA-dihydrouridine synthase A
MILNIAPMVDWTNTHFRVFMRLLSPNARVYTEMLTTGAIMNNSHRSLQFDKSEHPIAIQLGGACPSLLASCAKMAEQYDYDEVNLNLGCPSSKVSSGNFGASLMKEVQLSSQCLKAITDNVTIKVSAKTRIGIDDLDSYSFFENYILALAKSGIDTFIIHARKAWLNGLSPKQNRSIPQLNYDYVYRLKQRYPEFCIIINGGINSYAEIKNHLNLVDGVMLGRLAYQNPYAIALIDNQLFNSPPILRATVLKHYFTYCQHQLNQGIPHTILLKPIMNLANGLEHSRHWRQHVSMLIQKKEPHRQWNTIISLLEQIEQCGQITI